MVEVASVRLPVKLRPPNSFASQRLRVTNERARLFQFLPGPKLRSGVAPSTSLVLGLQSPKLLPRRIRLPE